MQGRVKDPVNRQHLPYNRNNSAMEGNLLVCALSFRGREPGTLTMEAWRLQIEVWRFCRPVVANPHHFNAHPDPVFHFNADPDPAFHFNEDPDLRPLVYRTSRPLF
jgi:hypothetical protein